MTRQIAMVNLSNWDGEDYEIVTMDYNGLPIRSTVRPGETLYLDDVHDTGGVLYKPVQRRQEDGTVIDKPFYNEDGKQTSPTIQVDIK